MGEWNIIRKGHEVEDMPQIAGYECLVSIENKCGQIFTTLAFTGYSDYKWYTNNSSYKQEPTGKDNHLHDAWKVLAWMPKPTPYNPYERDIRYVISRLSDKKKQGKKYIELQAAIDEIEDGFVYDHDYQSVREHDSHATFFWEE